MKNIPHRFIKTGPARFIPSELIGATRPPQLLALCLHGRLSPAPENIFATATPGMASLCEYADVTVRHPAGEPADIIMN